MAAVPIKGVYGSRGRRGGSSGRGGIAAIPITSMLTAAAAYLGPRVLEELASIGDPTATLLLKGRPSPPEVKAEAAPKSRPVMRFRGAKAKGPRPDAFYAEVASAYRWLVIEEGSRRPVLDLAKANRVPPSTAHRWIREARRRGILGPGVRGRAGL